MANIVPGVTNALDAADIINSKATTYGALKPDPVSGRDPSVSYLVDAEGLETGDNVRTLGYYAPGDGGGADYEVAASGTGSNYGFLYEQLTGSGLEAKLLGGGIMESKTAYIPTEYATLQAAIDALGALRPTSNATIDLMIVSGHLPESGLSVANGDYAHFSVSAQDAVVTVGAGWGFGDVVIGATNAHAPRLNCLWDCNGVGLQGYRLLQTAIGHVSPGCGVKNIPKQDPLESPGSTQGAGLIVSNCSSVRASESIFTGCHRNALVTSSSQAELSGATLTGAVNGLHGTYCTGLFVSRSCSVHASGADVSDSEYWGLRSHRGMVTANDLIANNCGHDALYIASGGFLAGGSIQANNAGRNGLEITSGATASVPLLSIDNATSRGIRATFSAILEAQSSSITLSGLENVAADASNLNVSGSTITRAGSGYDVTVRNGANVIMTDAITSTNTISDTNVTRYNFPFKAFGTISREDADNFEVPYIVESSSLNGNGYKLWSDKSLEQWGVISFDLSNTAAQDFTLAKPFGSATYAVSISSNGSFSTATTTALAGAICGSNTSSVFSVRTLDAQSGIAGLSYRAVGLAP